MIYYKKTHGTISILVLLFVFVIFGKVRTFAREETSGGFLYSNQERWCEANNANVCNNGTIQATSCFECRGGNCFLSPTPSPAITLTPTPALNPRISQLLTIANNVDPNIRITLIYPNETDSLKRSVYEFMRQHSFSAMAHEDFPLTRQFNCFSWCQFFNVEQFTNPSMTWYGDPGWVTKEVRHERVHNLQAARDSQLAEHVRGINRVQTNENRIYQSLVEGQAESVGEIGGARYAQFRTIYAVLKEWATQNNRGSIFSNSAMGDWNAFLNLESVYGSSGFDQLIRTYWVADD